MERAGSAEIGVFTRRSLTREGVVVPKGRPPRRLTLVSGVEHIVAMFGSTVRSYGKES